MSSVHATWVNPVQLIDLFAEKNIPSGKRFAKASEISSQELSWTHWELHRGQPARPAITVQAESAWAAPGSQQQQQQQAGHSVTLIGAIFSKLLGKSARHLSSWRCSGQQPSRLENAMQQGRGVSSVEKNVTGRFDDRNIEWRDRSFEGITPIRCQ